MPETQEQTQEQEGIVSLMERVNDDNETFTAADVRRIIDFTHQRAIDDIYNQTRIAGVMQAIQERKERSRTLLTALINSMGTESAPQLISVLEATYE